MFVVIAYDIADDRRRDRALAFLRGYGAHAQQSVFECELTERQLAEVLAGLRALIDPRADDVRCYLLDADAVARIKTLGIAHINRGVGYFLIG